MLSKSKYVAGLQCSKLLWHAVNRPEKFPTTDPATQAIFDQGHEIGALAKKLFPGGLEIGEGMIQRSAVVQWTREALPFRKPLFEAALEHDGGYARADILNPVGSDEWEIVECSTGVKDVFLDDLAFQYCVFSGAGLKLHSSSVLHVNNGYLRNGAIDQSALFTKVDVTSDVLARLADVPVRLKEMLDVVALDASPTRKIGPHCDTPYTCALHDQCWSFLPQGNVLELYRGKKKGFDLIDRGVTRLADVPDDFDLTPVQRIQRGAAIKGRPHVDHEAIRQFLARLQYPLHFLDFESFTTAIPLFDGVRPYNQLPFQYSLHVLNAAGEEPVHHSFLAEGARDPRRAFIESLQRVIGHTGSIIVYNAAFERTRLRECCECFPEIGAGLRGVEARILDLLVPFRGFAYYHPAQNGSASIKAVLPALCGQSYSHLGIQEGGTASREFIRITFGDCAEAERVAVRQRLLDYCCQDTTR